MTEKGLVHRHFFGPLPLVGSIYSVDDEYRCYESQNQIAPIVQAEAIILGNWDILRFLLYEGSLAHAED